MSVPHVVLASVMVLGYVVEVLQTSERQLACQQLESQHAEGEDVGCGQNCSVTANAVVLLRGHICVCAKHLVGTSEDVLGGHADVAVASDTEVRKCRYTTLLEEHVFGFQVTMDLAVGVQVVQTVEDLPADESLAPARVS